MLLIITTYSIPPAPPVLAAFWVIFFFPPCYLPLPVVVVVVAPLCHTGSHRIYRHRTPSIWTLHTLDNRQTSPLVSAPSVVWLHITSYPASIWPPFASLDLHLGPCWPLDVCPLWVPLFPLCTASLSVCCTASRNLLGLGISWSPFCWSTRGQFASTTWQYLLPDPGPWTPSPPRYTICMLTLRIRWHHISIDMTQCQVSTSVDDSSNISF